MPPEIEAFYSNNKSGESGPPLTLQQPYIILDTQFEWGMEPEHWKRMHVVDQAERMAYLHVKRSIEGYINDWYRKQAEAKNNTN